MSISCQDEDLSARLAKPTDDLKMKNSFKNVVELKMERKVEIELCVQSHIFKRVRDL